MNIKPTEQQVRKWAEGAGKYADMKRKTWEAWDLLRDQKLAELAAKWGAEQAQPNATPRKSMAYTPRQEQIIMVCDILHRISESYDHWKGWSGIQSSCEQAINLLRYDSTQAQQPTEKGTACSTSNFRKKPVVIQAKQLTEETIREVYELVHGPVTLKHRLAEDRWDDYCGIVKTDGMNIPTLEDGSDGRAKHVASIGDWIIRGIAGEFYPCKPDIFAATYEPVAQAQQTTEPELPEAAKCEGGWGELCVYYYTAAQMHEHYAAGVLAGAAGSQDANEEVVTITVPLSHINSLQVESIKRLVARTKHAHMTDVRIRINGNYEYFEADWLKYVVIGGGA